MKRLSLIPLLVLTIFTPAMSSAEEDPLPIRRVELFRGGVGYFEHHGKIEGEETVELRFKTEQVNDVLKSLLLMDLDGGAVSTVIYPSRDPVSKIMQSFQVDLSADPSVKDLLKQLRGTEVSITSNAERVQGKVMGLESRGKAEGDTVRQTWNLNLLVGSSIKSFDIEGISEFEIMDSTLRGEIQEALKTLSEDRGSDTKPIQVLFSGEGERRVKVGYLVETPLWKASYRLVLPEEDSTEGYLQGWAIVENQTDNDWEGIELSLVSGRPISFIQDLYQPLYLPRPTVQPDLQARLQPQTYTDGVIEEVRLLRRSAGDSEKPELEYQSSRGRYLADTSGDGIGLSYSADYAPAPAAVAEESIALGDYVVDLDQNIAAGKFSNQAVGSEVGELFRFTVEGVTLPRQRSAMIPIVHDPVQIERVSIYNSGVHKTHPLNGARMENTTEKHLLQGPLTVFDENTYAGDARIESIPPNQERLLTYALDLDLKVLTELLRDERSLVTVKIVPGTLHITRKRVRDQEYRIANHGDKEKVLLVEHPISAGWNLISPEEVDERTDTHYRFRVPVSASDTATLVVNEEKDEVEGLSILSTNAEHLNIYIQAREISPEVIQALEAVVAWKREIVNIEREIQSNHQRIQEITQEQERIRSNMQTIRDQTSSDYIRLLKKLDEQETELEEIRIRIEGLEAQRNATQKSMEDYIKDLKID